jgi:hypothetical protein
VHFSRGRWYDSENIISMADGGQGLLDRQVCSCLRNKTPKRSKAEDVDRFDM